jgi:hypothetical protein
MLEVVAPIGVPGQTGATSPRRELSPEDAEGKFGGSNGA